MTLSNFFQYCIFCTYVHLREHRGKPYSTFTYVYVRETTGNQSRWTKLQFVRTLIHSCRTNHNLNFKGVRQCLVVSSLRREWVGKLWCLWLNNIIFLFWISLFRLRQMFLFFFFNRIPQVMTKIKRVKRSKKKM